MVPLYDRVEWSIVDNRFNLYQQKDEAGNTIQGFSEINGAYSMYLPSVDFDIELFDDLIFRTSYSLTVTRPVYNDLKGALIIDYLGPDGGGGRRGNPQLLPMESKISMFRWNGITTMQVMPQLDSGQKMLTILL